VHLFFQTDKKKKSKETSMLMQQQRDNKCAGRDRSSKGLQWSWTREFVSGKEVYSFEPSIIRSRVECGKVKNVEGGKKA